MMRMPCLTADAQVALNLSSLTRNNPADLN
jgi:hypothetical protein